LHRRDGQQQNEQRERRRVVWWRQEGRRTLPAQLLQTGLLEKSQCHAYDDARLDSFPKSDKEGGWLEQRRTARHFSVVPAFEEAFEA
jgi:hypothetical protein